MMPVSQGSSSIVVDHKDWCQPAFSIYIHLYDFGSTGRLPLLHCWRYKAPSQYTTFHSLHCSFWKVYCVHYHFSYRKVAQMMQQRVSNLIRYVSLVNHPIVWEILNFGFVHLNPNMAWKRVYLTFKQNWELQDHSHTTPVLDKDLPLMEICHVPNLCFGWHLGSNASYH